jgi:hypothetical protein
VAIFGDGPGGAATDPGDEVVDDAAGELVLGRHLEVVIGVADGLDKQALVGVAGDERSAGVTALEQCGAAVDAEVVGSLVAAVAVEALVHQHGADAGFEVGLGVAMARLDGVRSDSREQSHKEAGEQNSPHGCPRTGADAEWKEKPPRLWGQ